ncbi:MAG: cyclic nucleotide-binding domain-containing protein [Oligoflexia bacterium]|nr:cyclic nucleotide-binding domain-containing protein [Oligoflexia bacterium]
MQSTTLTQLKKTPLFADFSDDELTDILDLTKRDVFNPGDSLISRGEAPSQFYLILFGSVQAHLSNPQGEREMITVYGSGSTLGVAGVVSGQPWAIDAEEVERSEIVVFPWKELDRYFSSHAHVAAKFYRALVKQIMHSWSLAPEELLRIRQASCIDTLLRALM